MQHPRRSISAWLAATAAWLTPSLVWAAEEGTQDRVVKTGVSGVWVLCNISYAGMRAQNHPSRGWRIAAFIFGLPGTIVTYFAVREGAHRAYGVKLPPSPPAV
jgi:hypothetical protein